MDKILCIRLSEGRTEFGNVLEVLEFRFTQLFGVAVKGQGGIQF